MRRRILFSLLLLTVLIWSGSLQNLAQGVRESLLQVFDVQPSPAGRLALDEAVTFTFNRRVDCAEAEAALTWQPAIRGTLTCDEYSITFEPIGEYQRSAQYTFHLTPPLRAKDGAPLFDPYRVTFAAAGYFEVSEVFPQPDSATVPVDSAITVVFDRPIVPLLASTDEDELPHPLVLSPATAGSGEWVNSAVYVFTPAAPLRGVTNYTAVVAADLEGVDRSVLESAVAWSFETTVPSVISVHPRPMTSRPRNFWMTCFLIRKSRCASIKRWSAAP